MAYAHTFGELDFTDHDKWMVTDITSDPQNRAEFAPGAGVGSIYLVDYAREGDQRVLAVTCRGDLATCEASMLEIEDQIDAACNAAASNGSLTPVDYVESLSDTTTPTTWEVVYGSWKQQFGLIIGGNAVDGIMMLRLKQD